MVSPQRCEELLVDAVTEGLPPPRERELLRYESAAVAALRFDLERASAAVDLAFGYRELEMPSALVERLRDQARGFMAASGAAEAGPARATGRSAVAERGRVAPSPSWLLAAAALLLAVLGWWPRLQSGSRAAEEPAERIVTEDGIEADPALVRLRLAGTGDPAARGASGTLEWSPAEQRGRMEIVGLAVNDPAKFQYQLWIFDASRDDRYPIDGGLFDVPTGSPLSVPVQAAVPVREPTLFAVTVEPSGGVVVSSRQRIVLAGQVG